MRAKQVFFRYVQPATVAAIVAFWALLPERLVENPLTIIVAAFRPSSSCSRSNSSTSATRAGG